MDVDAEKLQQAVLALLLLNTINEKSGKRAWKALPWSVMDQLHDKGYISNPATKAKSVCLSDAHDAGNGVGECAKQGPIPVSMPQRRSELDDADKAEYERYGVTL